MISSVGPGIDRSLRDLEGRAASCKEERDTAQLQLDGTSRRLGEAERRMAELRRDILAVARKDQRFGRWMAVTNWAGRAAAGGAVVGLGLIGSNPIVGAACFFGGLAGFAASYLIQMKARVRHAEIMSEAWPRQGELESWEQTKARDAQEAQGLRARVESADGRLREIQSKLDVMRMASAPGPEPGKVAVDGSAVRIGGIAVPRNQKTSTSGE